MHHSNTLKQPTLQSHSANFSALASALTSDFSTASRRSTISSDEPPLPSDSLLKGQKVVAIVHKGNLYKLQATKLGKLGKLGKLILTK